MASALSGRSAVMMADIGQPRPALYRAPPATKQRGPYRRMFSVSSCKPRRGMVTFFPRTGISSFEPRNQEFSYATNTIGRIGICDVFRAMAATRAGRRQAAGVVLRRHGVAKRCHHADLGHGRSG